MRALSSAAKLWRRGRLVVQLADAEWWWRSQGHARATHHKPEVILNNFDTVVGQRVGRLLATLFSQDSAFKGRQVATFHNQRDFIFFRCLWCKIVCARQRGLGHALPISCAC